MNADERRSNDGRCGICVHLRSSAVPSVAIAVLLAGCGAYEGAHVCLVTGPLRARPRSPVFRSVWSEPREEAPSPWTVTLRRDGTTGRAMLEIVGAAVRMVPALGSPRGAVEGVRHFTMTDGPRLVARLARANGGASETWLIDGEWALAALAHPTEGGAMLVWQGDLAAVVQTMALVFPRAAGR